MPDAIDAEARERALAAHLSGTATHRAVAGLLGVTPRVLTRLKAEWAWPPSPLRPAGFARGAERRNAGAGDLAARLDRLLRRRVAALERAPADLAPAEAERIARALAVHVRTLSALRDLAEPRPARTGDAAAADKDDDDAAPPPRTLAELRDELCRQLERIRLEERAGNGPDPDGADPP